MRTTYAYRLAAVDNNGNSSAQCAAVSATTTGVADVDATKHSA